MGPITTNERLIRAIIYNVVELIHTTFNMVSMQVFRTMELPTVQGWSENYLSIKYSIK